MLLRGGPSGRGGVRAMLSWPNRIKPKWYLNSQIAVFTPTDPARLVRTESVPCDINNPLRKPPRYSDLHISQTLPKTNKISKVRLGSCWIGACWAPLPCQGGVGMGLEDGSGNHHLLAHWVLHLPCGLCQVKLGGHPAISGESVCRKSVRFRERRTSENE